MSLQYYIVNDGTQQGPFPAESLPAHGLTGDSYIWREGLPGWTKARDLPELSSLLYGTPSSTYQQEEQASAYAQPQTPPPYQQPYQQPHQGYNPGNDPYRQYGRSEEPVPHTNWLPWAIVATVVSFCLSCIGMIFGIVGIVQANKANTFYDRGWTQRGDQCNSTAKTMTIIAFVLAVIGLIVGIVNFSSGGIDEYRELMEEISRYN